MNKNFIIGTIKKIFDENMIEFFKLADNDRDNKYPIWWAFMFKATGLNEQGSDLFNKVVENILESHEINEIVTRDEVMSYLRSTLTELLTIENNVRLKSIIKEVRSIESKLNSLKENVELIFPIINLKLNRRFIQLGNIKIFNFTNYQLQKVLNSIKHLMVNNPHYKDNPNEIKSWMESHKKGLQNKYFNKVCAIVDSDKSPKKNYENAIKQIEISLACLKLFSNTIHIGNNCQFGLVGSILKRDKIECFISNKNQKGHRTDGGFVGYAYSFDIDDEFIKKAKINGLIILNQILKKSKINEIEKRILNSISWYAKSVDVFLADYHKNIDKNCDKQLNILSHSIGEKFLKLVICLESLLLFNEFNENKKEYLQQRSYFLFLCTKNDEKDIQDFIDESYNIRNNIVHQGYVNVDYSQLIELDYYVKRMIINLIKNYKKWNLETNMYLYKWFEKRRLNAL